jgi:cytochrome c biogenesis protein CcdA
VKSFTLAAVSAAAVVDSINPCAIATLVFFMSLLSVARISMGRMWLAGVAFLAASFVTYTAIGFGLLGVLQFLHASRVLRQALDVILAGVMLVFAALSFRDAIRYHRSGQAGDVTMKLPAGLQNRIHRVMKSGFRKRSLVLGGLGVGVVVTAIESVCTGQIYVPTLVLMVKQGESVLRCAGYLVVYNAIFVLPLVVTLALTCGGMSTPVLVEWSRRNVTVSKTVMGVFFLVMTGVLLVLR